MIMENTCQADEGVSSLCNAEYPKASHLTNNFFNHGIALARVHDPAENSASLRDTHVTPPGQVYTPLGKKVGIFLTPEAPLIPKSLFVLISIEFASNFLDLGMDFAGIQFYEPLASSLHPAEAFSPVKTAFLEILSMSPITFLGFLLFFCVCKPLVSKLHPAGAFSWMKITSLEISSMGIIEIPTFFPRGL